ncbi:leucyl aminopeptidase [Planctomonas psychrotolerans]|uniref:leucyl aminopeptidase n=1 Tax=Planctomonas psychrotolerans TaxID=2528712 RepID=UPI00123C0681|nr:leucyl aminopeptidase [Planctomonas psychrotolerans]
MTIPNLLVSAASPSEAPAEVLVIGVIPEGDGARILAPDGFDALNDNVGPLRISGGPDELTRVVLPGSTTPIALIGLGPAPITPDSLRYAAGSAVRQLVGVASVALALPLDSDDDLSAVLEGAVIGGYSFTAFRGSGSPSTKTPAAEVVVLTDRSPDDGVLDRATSLGTAMAAVRDLENTPPGNLSPADLADAAIAHAEGLPVEVTVWDETMLAEEGFGGILGVGSGSTRPPRLVKVAYSPEDAGAHLALVGKGITFDSGGLSLKPAIPMIGMKFDMTGAATVLEVVLAAARLALPIRLTAWLCIAENMPSGSAMRVDDVLRIRGGKTVEVLNTDAEGRLVMADGLVAASEERPDYLIDVATLTGAQVVALGNRTVGAMGDDAFVSRVVAAATGAGESIWAMPLPGELRPLLNSDVADLANAKPGQTAAGMLLAGVFLREFVGTVDDSADASPIPWAHLDIAGPSNNQGSPYGFTGKGATGVTVRTLLALAEEISRA